MAGKRQAASADMESEILDVEAVGFIGHRRRRRERDTWAAALGGEGRKLETRWWAAEEPPTRVDRKAVRVSAQFEVAGRGAAGRRQLDASDRLPGDFGSGELRDPRDNLRAPEVSDLEVDLQAFDPVRVDGHPVAVRRDRKHLLALRDGGARFCLKSAGQLREDERREIVEIGRAEAQVAGRQSVGANGEGAGEPRRSEADAEIVDGPAAVAVSCDMR